MLVRVGEFRNATKILIIKKKLPNSLAKERQFLRSKVSRLL